ARTAQYDNTAFHDGVSHGDSQVQVLSRRNGKPAFHLYRSDSDCRGRGRAAARPLQHVTRRITQPVAKADALARRPAVYSHHHNHANGLGDGTIGPAEKGAPWWFSIASIPAPGMTVPPRSAPESGAKNMICVSLATGR